MALLSNVADAPAAVNDAPPSGNSTGPGGPGGTASVSACDKAAQARENARATRDLRELANLMGAPRAASRWGAAEPVVRRMKSLVSANPVDALKSSSAGTLDRVCVEIEAIADLLEQRSHVRAASPAAEVDALVAQARAKAVRRWLKDIRSRSQLGSGKVDTDDIVRRLVSGLKDRGVDDVASFSPVVDLATCPLNSETLVRWAGLNRAEAKHQLFALRASEKITLTHSGPRTQAREELLAVNGLLCLVAANANRAGKLEVAVLAAALASVARRTAGALRLGVAAIAPKPADVLTDVAEHLGLPLETVRKKAPAELKDKLRSRVEAADLIAAARACVGNTEFDMPALRAVERARALMQGGKQQASGASVARQLGAAVRLYGSAPNLEASHTMSLDKMVGLQFNPVITLKGVLYAEPLLFSAEGRRGSSFTIRKSAEGMQLEYGRSSAFQVKQGLEVGVGFSGLASTGLVSARLTTGVSGYVSQTHSSAHSTVLTVKHADLQQDGAYAQRAAPALPGAPIRVPAAASVLSRALKDLARVQPQDKGEAIAVSLMSGNHGLTIGDKSTQSLDYGVDFNAFVTAKLDVPVLGNHWAAGPLLTQSVAGTLGLTSTQKGSIALDSSGTGVRASTSEGAQRSLNLGITATGSVKLGVSTPSQPTNLVHQASVNNWLNSREIGRFRHGTSQVAEQPVKTFTSWKAVKAYCDLHGHRVPKGLEQEFAKQKQQRVFTLVQYTATEQAPRPAVGTSTGSSSRRAADEPVTKGLLLRVAGWQGKTSNRWYPFSFLFKFSKVARNETTVLLSEHELGFEAATPAKGVARRLGAVAASLWNGARRFLGRAAPKREATPIAGLDNVISMAVSAGKTVRTMSTQFPQLSAAALQVASQWTDRGAAMPNATQLLRQFGQGLSGLTNGELRQAHETLSALVSSAETRKQTVPPLLVSLREATEKLVHERVNEVFRDRAMDLVRELANTRLALGHDASEAQIEMAAEAVVRRARLLQNTELDRTLGSYFDKERLLIDMDDARHRLAAKVRIKTADWLGEATGQRILKRLLAVPGPALYPSVGSVLAATFGPLAAASTQAVASTAAAANSAGKEKEDPLVESVAA